MNIQDRLTEMFADNPLASIGCIVLAVFVPVLGPLLLHSLLSLIPLNIAVLKDGRHTGYITAVEDNVRPVISDNTTTVYVKTELESSQENQYCVRDADTELIKNLKEAAKSKKNITIKYNAYKYTGIGNCAGDTIVGIEE